MSLKGLDAIDVPSLRGSAEDVTVAALRGLAARRREAQSSKRDGDTVTSSCRLCSDFAFLTAIVQAT